MNRFCFPNILLFFFHMYLDFIAKYANCQRTAITFQEWGKNLCNSFYEQCRVRNCRWLTEWLLPNCAILKQFGELRWYRLLRSPVGVKRCSGLAATIGVLASETAKRFFNVNKYIEMIIWILILQFLFIPILINRFCVDRKEASFQEKLPSQMAALPHLTKNCVICWSCLSLIWGGDNRS